ncbi:hypothetical protein AUP68_10570 [Ilyonectria robusta]
MPFPFKVTAGVQAARHILMQRNRPQRDARSKPLSLRAAATAFGTSKSDVQRHLVALEKSGRPAFSDRGVGRPRNLDNSEDRALVAYIMWLERCGFPATRIQVEEAANMLRQSRSRPCGPVGEGWYPRFVNDHPELQKKGLIRALHRDRAAFESGDLTDLDRFFSRLSEVIQLRNLSASQKIFDQGFTTHNIMNGFEKTGIFPVDGSGVIQTLKEKKRDLLAMSTPALQSLLPKESRFRDARELSRHIRHSYGNDFSSPTRQRFAVIDDVLAEAVTLSDLAESHIKSRHERIAAANNRKRTRKSVKPSGQYLNSVSVQQIKESLQTTIEKDQEQDLRRQRREIKRLQKQHYEQYRAEWQSQWKYDVNNNGKPIHISFERWLRWSGKKRDDDVISIPGLSPRASPTPEQRSWYYDTTRPAAYQRFYERLRDATAACAYRSPLQEMPFPLSSDGVDFRIGNVQEDHTNNNNLITGDTDESDNDEDGIPMLDLTQEGIEEPELPPLPPPSPTPATFTSKYYRLMSILHPPGASQEASQGGCITVLGSPLPPE